MLKLLPKRSFDKPIGGYVGLGVIGAQRYYQASNSKRRQPKSEYEEDWKILNLDENSDQDQVRRAYLDLAKRFHPDSGSTEASSPKFHQIDIAYKNLQKKFADDRHNSGKIEGEYGLYYEIKKGFAEEQKAEASDIKHTAPQHRQYLNYDGVGSGTPVQREKQYQKYRAFKAAENVHEHRVKKIAEESNAEETNLSKNVREAKKIKTGLGIERLVEDMIQESMARGDFENLAGKGKPLNQNDAYNPYIDFTTHKLNQVLIDNGFTPEWILLEKEIRQEIRDIRHTLSVKRHEFGEELTATDHSIWTKFLDTWLKPELKQLNSKINKYNLVVPTIHKQIIGLNLERESRLAIGKYSVEFKESLKKQLQKEEESSDSKSKAQLDQPQGFFGLFYSFLK